MNTKRAYFPLDVVLTPEKKFDESQKSDKSRAEYALEKSVFFTKWKGKLRTKAFLMKKELNSERVTLTRSWLPLKSSW